MDKYQEILNNVGKQMNGSEEDYNSYRYTGLIHAIEFFSQRFSIEEIMEHIYDFTNEMIVPDRIVLFRRDNQDMLVVHKGKGFDHYSPIQGYELDRIVYYHAGILTQDTVKEYMDPKEVASYNPDIIIQLIMDKEMFGFVFLCRDGDSFNREDQIIANALMNLFYTSLTNYISFHRMEELTKELDEKIYNLFAMNYSSKALLGELEEEALNQLSISIFSEMTQSRITAVFVYDSVREAYPLIQLQDVFQPERTSRCILYPKEKQLYISGQEVIDCSDEQAFHAFMAIFNNPTDELLSLEPRYILPVCDHQQLIALITISSKVTDEPYKKSEFELLESLVSSTYIAMRNAQHMKEVQEAQHHIKNQLDDLAQLNVLMKNLNTATSESALLQLMMTTLELSFGFSSMFYCKLTTEQDSHRYTYLTQEDIMEAVEGKEKNIRNLPEAFVRGEALYLYDIESFEAFIEDMELVEELDKETFTGMVCIPISVEAEEERLLGILGVGKVQSGYLFDKSRILILESIASHLAPVLYQIYERQRIQSHYKPDYSQAFLERMKEELRDAKELDVALFILAIYRKNAICFNSLWDKLQQMETIEWTQEIAHVYPIDYSHVMCISDDRDLLEWRLQSNEFKQVLNEENAVAKVYAYGDDFVDMETFLQVIQGE